MIKGHRQAIGWQDEQLLLSAVTNPTPAARILRARRTGDLRPGLPLELTPDELLATTRSVRKRLDLTSPVERHMLADCPRLAQQAPTASYA